MASSVTKFEAIRMTKPHDGMMSYWQIGDQVYRLNEYEPVQFDIYGVPLGARWECSKRHWDSFHPAA